MKKESIHNFTKGWFIGNFEPTLLKTKDFEIGFKTYKAGEYENKHLHKIATEYTLIANGRVRMNGTEYNEGDIIIVEPNESTDFLAITDTMTVVVKSPSISNDKFLI